MKYEVYFAFLHFIFLKNGAYKSSLSFGLINSNSFFDGLFFLNFVTGISSIIAKGVCYLPSPMTKTAATAKASTILALVTLSFRPKISGVLI